MTPRRPRSGSESGQEDPASLCQCGLSQPLRIVLVSQEGACPGRVSPLQPKHEGAYCWHPLSSWGAEAFIPQESWVPHGWAALLESLGDRYFGLDPLFYRSGNLSPDKTNTLSSIKKIQSGVQNQVSQSNPFLHVPQCRDFGIDRQMEHGVIRLQLTFCPPETSKQFSVLFSVDVEIW